ncbi:MAG TPA: hypothetical protein VGN19_08965 [Pedococcus sp.]|jgi:hypothetical protein|nr:hypothetical protein [Pedococcus sp.]
MTTSELGALRLARAFGFAVAAFALSVGAHVLAGGTPPSLTASLVLGGSTAWASLFLTGRRLGARSMVVAMGLAQVLLHEALMMSTPGGRCTGLDRGGNHLHALSSAARSVCTAMPSLPHAHGIPLGMSLAHAVAAILVGLVLARGESAIWFLAALVWPSRPVAVVVPVRRPRAWSIPTVPAVRRRSQRLAPISRRGPPHGPVVATR